MGALSKFPGIRYLRIGLALACPFLAWVLQQWLWDIGVHLPFLLFYPTVIASALIGGGACGIVATFVVAGIDVWAFVPPRGSWSIANPIDLVTTSIFVATGLLLSWLVAIYSSQARRLVALNAELACRADAADAAAVAKSAFLANMSHEIRTPLNAVIGMAHLIREDGLTGRQEERLDKLEAAAEHLLQILNAILDLSKIDAGKFTLEERPLRIESVVSNVLSMLEGRAHEKGLRLVSTVDTVPSNLIGDPTRLQQALLNYASNAIKFTDAGSVTVRARLLDQDHAGALLRFEVEDTGIGIDPAVMPNLFTAFSQADNSATRKAGGTGLGLAITRRLAELMGGEVGATSTPGQGSTFWLTVRLRKQEGAVVELPEVEADDAVSILRRDHGGARVLLAEDNEVNREVATALLAAAGLVVDPAEDGAVAVAKVATNDYALVLMDMQMPRMGGLEATREIRRTRPCGTLPIVAMTANAFSEDRARCMEAGMDEFISKPVEPRELYRLVRKVLRHPDGQPARSGVSA